MRLRDVEVGDVDAYVRMRCDPAMMAELGGPQPRAGIEEIVRRHACDTRSGAALICLIVPGEDPAVVAGTVALAAGEHDGESLAEIGWAVLPEFQGRGLAKTAVRLLLDRARGLGRSGLVHAFPAVTNAPSNGVCRSVGFTLLGQRDVWFAGKLFHSNHWQIDISAAPTDRTAASG
ncbi:MAG TPA: GNAT family N-acetyltransferase [Pseudonocardiaceae bacterium]|jgi:RimJ/RimL family protein N-acetyltransferase|nr:GNAT family N-acetyltransferase [Pseudonocardiaceae bacterium]